MIASQTKSRISSWHKWMGLILSIPLLGWIISSAVLIFVTFDAPNGLAGVYKLQPYNSVDIRLDNARLKPTDILQKLSNEYGIQRVHWLRLESRGAHLLYVVRPTPFSLAMTFDANTGKRLDPLSDELLIVTANEALVGTHFKSLEDKPEFNRDYEVDRVPAVAARVIGEQPSILMLSRDSGRTLRRLDADAERFNWWYKTFHVNQFTDDVIPWTALLYTCVIGVIVLVVFGYMIFWWRRKRLFQVPQSNDSLFSARNLHRKVGVAVGGVLIVQLIAGIYIWLSLGPLNDPFRGKSSFSDNWNAGISTQQRLEAPALILAKLSQAIPVSARPVQSIEWRRLGKQDVWFISTRKDERPIVFDATNGSPIDALHPMVAGEIARQEMLNQPSFEYLEPLHFSSMDLAQRLPAYRFRFNDADVTDVYVLQNTGEIVMRRPAFWRIFGPFLQIHMLAITKNKIIDITLLVIFQLSFLLVIITGWRLQFPGRREKR